MSYKLGLKSNLRLQGVHPDLVKVVRRAIELTEVDFTVLEGLRSLARQKQLVAAGASKTMASRHITGHAVDLGALVAGKVRWDWPLYHKLADAMKAASQEVGVPIEWGGVWDKAMSEYADPVEETAAYIARRKKGGKSAFIDGPHFQLPRAQYPG